MVLLKVSYYYPLVLGLLGNANAFSACHRSTISQRTQLRSTNHHHEGYFSDDVDAAKDRRTSLQQLASIGLVAMMAATSPLPAYAEDFSAQEQQRKYIQESYEDFTKTNEGWLYRQVKEGSGDKASEGDRVVFDWSGYTIGYFGRPFQAKGYDVLKVSTLFCRFACLRLKRSVQTFSFTQWTARGRL